MTARVWPVDAVGGVPAYGGRALRHLLSVPVGGAMAARPLGARSGVRIGTPSSTVSVSGSTWTVAPHAGVLDVQSAAVAGAYCYALDAAETGTVPAAHATLTQISTVYVQVSDPVEDGTSVPALTVGVTAAATTTPAAPARAMALAWLTRTSAATGGVITVQWIAPHAAASGGIIPVRSQAERDLITWGTPLSPALVYRADLDMIERNVTGSPANWDHVAGGAPSISNAAWSTANTFTNTTPGTDPGSIFVWTPPRSGIAHAVLTMDVQQGTAGYVLLAMTPRVNGGPLTRTSNYFGPQRSEERIVCDPFRVRAGEAATLDVQVSVFSGSGGVTRNGGSWRVTVE